MHYSGPVFRPTLFGAHRSWASKRSFRCIVAMFVWNCELQLVFVVKYELDYEDLEVISSQNSNIVQLCTLISDSSVLKSCNLRKWTRDIISQRLLEFPSPRRYVTCVFTLHICASLISGFMNDKMIDYALCGDLHILIELSKYNFAFVQTAECQN